MKTFAIIGLGPRGLYALENLLMELGKHTLEIKILVFETSSNPGSGTVWHPKQSDSNWINITERALKDLDGRPKFSYSTMDFEPFPSYHEWMDYSQNKKEPDAFPSRNKLGSYLHDRFLSLNTLLKTSEHFQIIKSKVVGTTLEKDNVIVTTDNNEEFCCSEILITVGHQPVERSEQIKKWIRHTKNKSLSVYEDPYPITQFNALKNRKDVTIGLRGFGLAMIDVMRGLTLNDYGAFEIVNASTFESKYIAKSKQNLKIVPFSLDGKPLVPKPKNKLIDDWFKPTDKELEYFKSEITAAAQSDKQVTTIDFLKVPITKLASRIFKDLDTKAMPIHEDHEPLELIVLKWLQDENFKHELIQDDSISTYKLIEAYINMALGETAISLDFCIGQVWRHCQPTLYKSFSHAKLDKEIIEKVIALDERSKRYSYGPPIESMQQLLALVNAKVLTLDYVTDPIINLTSKGWELKSMDAHTITTSVMINSVLDPPQLLKVTSPLIKNLLSNQLIQPVHSKLGIETHTNGLVISTTQNPIPIAVLGRLAQGSVIGVDAILECFGPRIEDWAKSIIRRLDN